MQTSSVAFKLVKELWFRNRNFCSAEYDACLDYIHLILPLNLHHFYKSDEINGWVIPPKWDLVHGSISFNGVVILDVKQPLQVIGLSMPVNKFVGRSELQKHLHFDHRDPGSIPYHFRQNYRPWERDWGFCVTREFYEALEEGSYEVKIITKESEGCIKVAEHTKKGKFPETFVFAAHLDHPGMANDDLAGVAVGVELFRRLSKLDTKFTYRLVILPEIIGSVFYLGQRPESRQHVIESCFLEMLGSNTELALQRSRKGDSLLELKLIKILDEKGCKYHQGNFRTIICNDEPVWESYGIPMASLSRFPYPEYHSHKDNLEIIHPQALEESVEILMDLVKELDSSTIVRKNFEGVLALSNPLYNLYVDPGQPAFGGLQDDKIKRLRLLMDLMPMFPKEISVDKIIAETQLTKDEVLEYLHMWQEKKLLNIL